MICIGCLRGRESDKSLCQHCLKCRHLCENKCHGIIREKKIRQKRIEDAAFRAALAPKTEERLQPKLKLGEAKCAQCGGKFNRVYSFKIYCDDACNNRAKLDRERTKRQSASVGFGQSSCVSCNSDFTKSHPKQIYCSAHCRRRVQNKNYAAGGAA